jgi:predicted NBD/HSP70 family sugar kinase
VTLTIGVDIGGTKIAAGVVDQSGTILSETKVETPAKDPDAIASAVATAVERLRQEHQVIAVGSAQRASWTRPAPPSVRTEHLLGRRAARQDRRRPVRTAGRGGERRQRRDLG